MVFVECEGAVEELTGCCDGRAREIDAAAFSTQKNAVLTKLRFIWILVTVAVAGVAPLAAQTATLTPSTTTLNAAGGTVTFTFNATFTGTAIFGLSVLAPSGWSYAGGSGEPSGRPSVGSTGLLDWYDTSPLSSPVAFTFTLSYPAGATGASVLPASILRTGTSGKTTLAPATVNVGTIVDPTITTHPTGQTASVGANVTFAVVAAGTAPLAYQWFNSGVAVSGATSATLTLTGVQSGTAGAYAVRVSNSVGSIVSNGAVLTVLTPPSISSHPTSVSVVAGGSASFSVSASGSEPLSYQWKKDGTAVVGATSSTLTLTNLQSNQAGAYTVTVSNAAGSVTSNPATLTVGSATVAPVIVQSPASATAVAGSDVSFTVAATGTAPLIYQWRKDGANLSGATAATLALAAVQSAQSGSYSVVVTNGAGSRDEQRCGADRVGSP